MVVRWLAAKSKLTLDWHGHPTAVLAAVSGAHFHCTNVGPVPIPPWGCSHPYPNTTWTEGCVPSDAEGAGPREGDRTAKAVSPLLSAIVSIKSQNSSNTTPPPFLSDSPHTLISDRGGNVRAMIKAGKQKNRWHGISGDPWQCEVTLAQGPDSVTTSRPTGHPVLTQASPPTPVSLCSAAVNPSCLSRAGVLSP